MLRSGSSLILRQARARPITLAWLLKHPQFSTALRMSNANLNPVQPPVSSVLPSDSFQLLHEQDKPKAEDALFEAEVKDVRDWWATERYQGIKRTYSAEDVVSKRGTLQQTYPSSLMARKLFNLLKERAAKGEPVHTST